MKNTTIPAGSVELPQSLTGNKEPVGAVLAWIDNQDLRNTTSMTMNAIREANPEKTISSSLNNLTILYAVGHGLGVSKANRGDKIRNDIQAIIKADRLTPPQFELVVKSLDFDETTTRIALEKTIIKYSKGDAKKDGTLAADYAAIRHFCMTHKMGKLVKAIEEQVANEQAARREGFRMAGIERARQARRQAAWEERKAAREQRQARKGPPSDVNSREEFPGLP